MRVFMPTFLPILLSAGCASVAPAERLDYGCNDLVVVGRLRTLSSTPANAPTDILEKSVWNGEVDIKTILRGKERRRTVKTASVSHAQVRDDIDLVIVLSTSEDADQYSVKTLSTWPTPLASHCTSE